MLYQSRGILAGTCADSSVHIEHAGEGGGGGKGGGQEARSPIWTRIWVWQELVDVAHNYFGDASRH